MNIIDIGQRIRVARKEKNMTLQDIANDIGVAKSTIQRYENGLIENIKLPVLEAIARSIGIDPAWLLGKSQYKEFEKIETTPPEIGSEEWLRQGMKKRGFNADSYSAEQLSAALAALDGIMKAWDKEVQK